MKDTYISIKGQSIFTRFYPENYDKNQPTIVFLHEGLGSVAQWRDFPKRVAEKTGFNAFAFDRLGHGLSDPLVKNSNNSLQNERNFDYLHHEAWEVTPSVCEVFFYSF